FALIHGPIAVRHLIEVYDTIKDAAGMDLAFQDVRQELGDVCAHRCGAATDRNVIEETWLRGRYGCVVRHADATNGRARAGHADRCEHGLFGANAFKYGMHAGPAREFAHAFDGLFAPFADHIRGAKVFGQRDPIGMVTQNDDLFGAQPFRGDDTAQTHSAVANHGDLLTLAHTRRHRSVVPRP